VVVRFEAKGLGSGRSFYTDANGREMVLRRRDYMPTWDLEVRVRGCDK
jgi:hypothetical protein